MVNRQARLQYYLAMMIFGSIGIFVRSIPMASIEIAFLRSFLGTVSIGTVLFFRRKPFPKNLLKEEGGKLLLSGAFLGVNWIFLFEAFRKTTITSATLAYYMAPIVFLLLTAVLFKLKLTKFRVLTIGAAFLGLFVLQGGNFMLGGRHRDGILFGLMAAFFYAMVMLLGRSIKKVDGLHRTFLNLLVSFLVLSLYMALTGTFRSFEIPYGHLGSLLLVGFVHTGIAYALYFSSLDRLEAQEVALASYLDPLFAIVFSVLFLKEPFTGSMLLGGILILGSSIVYELFGKKQEIERRNEHG